MRYTMKKTLALLPILPLLLLWPACQDDAEAEPDDPHDAAHDAPDEPDAAHDVAPDDPHGDADAPQEDPHGDADAPQEDPSDAPLCPAAVTISDLPGVSLRFVDAPCALSLAQAAQGVRVKYEVVVEAPPEGVPRAVWPRPQDAGGCGLPGDSGLIVSEQVQGEQRRWCLCDTGLCQAPEEVYGELTLGAYPGEFVWDGVEWEGPSDFGNPPGPPVPAGAGYEFVVSAKGRVRFSGAERDFTVEARAPFTLTP
jgi:hypothetical protein